MKEGKTRENTRGARVIETTKRTAGSTLQRASPHTNLQVEGVEFTAAHICRHTPVQRCAAGHGAEFNHVALALVAGEDELPHHDISVANHQRRPAEAKDVSGAEVAGAKALDGDVVTERRKLGPVVVVFRGERALELLAIRASLPAAMERKRA